MIRRLAVVALTLASPSAFAVEYKEGAGTLTLEAFGNFTGGDASGKNLAGYGFGELRLLGLYDTGHNLAIGPRLTYRGYLGDNVDESARWGERSLILLGSWGRFEFGERRGLPDVLTGYAPNNYQFVSAEYGPASGPSLDPDGGLPLTLLDSALAAQIAPMTGLGITASFFGDESAKAIYVSPKWNGFLAGVSYAPEVDNVGNRFKDLVQTGLTWEHYSGQDVYRLGGTYAFASGENTGALHTDDLQSLSLGAGATLNDALNLGVSFTYDGDTGLTRGPGPAFESNAYGYAASANYNLGAWTFGGFIQTARAEGDTANSGIDRLNALQFGASYRSSTHIRYFGALYLYEFDDEGGAGALADPDGAIGLVGVRLNL